MKSKGVLKEGVIKETHGYGVFLVELDNGHVCTCKVSGKMSNAKINVMIGDRVEVELSIYDLNNGRIIRRISGRQINNNNNNNQKKKK